MKSKFFLPLLLASFSLAFNACTDDDEQGVGASVQPAGDLLCTYSNKVDVSTSSILVDSVLSKSENVYLGQYTDTYFGTTQCEFLAQLDARVDGITVPDITVSKTDNKAGVRDSILTYIDSNFGVIKKITDATEVTVDSAFYRMYFDANFLGDSMALQAVSIYEMTGILPTYGRHFSNLDASKYCDKKTLLGSLGYQVSGKYNAVIGERVLDIPIKKSFAEEVTEVYTKGGVKNQNEFNQKFPGVYVSHSFNEGAIIKLKTLGLLVYYHYHGKIHTTYNGKDTIVDSHKLGMANPLVGNYFLSSNKSVERVNLFRHPYKASLSEMANSEEFSYAVSPAGLYTKVNVDFNTIRDSIYHNAGHDSSKIMVNSAILSLNTFNLNWSTKLTKSPSSYMLLINKDSIVDFFYNNKTPDGVTSMYALLDTATNSYNFDLSRAVQKRVSGTSGSDVYLENLVVLPITVTKGESNYYYNQQLWPTAVRMYKNNKENPGRNPRINLVYTRRE